MFTDFGIAGEELWTRLSYCAVCFVVFVSVAVIPALSCFSSRRPSESKMAPTTTIETVTITRPLKVSWRLLLFYVLKVSFPHSHFQGTWQVQFASLCFGQWFTVPVVMSVDRQWVSISSVFPTAFLFSFFPSFSSLSYNIMLQDQFIHLQELAHSHGHHSATIRTDFLNFPTLQVPLSSGSPDSRLNWYLMCWFRK